MQDEEKDQATEVAIIIEDIQSLRQQFTEFKLSWIPQRLNYIAHDLAKHMTEMATVEGFWQNPTTVTRCYPGEFIRFCNIYTYYWGGMPPPCIVNNLHSDTAYQDHET